MKKIFTLSLLFSYVVVNAQCYSSISSKGLHNISIKSDGTMWAWGRNDEDQIGDNSNTDQLSPIQLGTDSDWATISAGTYYSAAIKTDGTLWAWGSNSSGQTGPTSSDIPQMIGTDNDWVFVSTGLGFTSAIKSNGTLWIWGFNNYGQLGNGTTISSNTPAQVGSDTDWVAVSNGSQHVLALKSDGTLWSWGLDDAGQLGHGDGQNMSLPTQVGTESDWTNISAGYAASAAIKTNGTLWVWGYNEYGMVGDGTTIDRYTPTQVGIETDWSSVAITTHTMAIKTNGTLWAWGRNNYGKIGNGLSTGSQLTPVQIGSDTDWIMAVPGFEHSIAIKGNGTIYTWGHNNEGQLGDGTTVDKILPTQIGTLCTSEFCSIPDMDLSDFNAQCQVSYNDLIIPTIVDSCGNTITATLYIGTFPITSQGTTTILWKFSNVSEYTTVPQDITLDDTIAPDPDQEIITDISAQCIAAIDDVEIPTATDTCSGTIVGVPTPNFPIMNQGLTAVTWTFDDGNGNISSQIQNIIIDDTLTPVANNENLPVLTGQCEVANIVLPTASDNCAGNLTAMTNDPLTYEEQGTYVITWTYNDGNGNTSSQTQTVIVNDTIAPEIITQNIEVDLAGAPSVSIEPEQVNNGSLDNCSSVSLELNTSVFTEPGVYTVTLLGTDIAGNSASAVAIITVVDSSLGIDEVISPQIKIFPIPAKELLYIEMPDNTQIITSTIYDMLGRAVLSYGNQKKLDISSLSNGYYSIIIQVNNISYKEAFIVE